MNPEIEQVITALGLDYEDHQRVIWLVKWLSERWAGKCERFTDPEDGEDSAADTKLTAGQCAALIREDIKQ